MQDVVRHLASGESSSYSPTHVAKEKYARVVEGRNNFLFAIAACASIGSIACFLPTFLVRRSVRKLFHNHCSGKALDLSPKVVDERSVQLYEGSRAVRVEFFVREKVVDDGRYRVDETLSEADQEERRRSMTLDHLCKNDPTWLMSPVTFSVVDTKDTLAPDFKPFDTVVVRYELCNNNDEQAKAITNNGLALLKDGGHLIVVEVGRSSNNIIRWLVEWFHNKTGSSLHLNRRYDTWFGSGMQCVWCERRIFGCHYAVALRKGSP